MWSRLTDFFMASSIFEESEMTELPTFLTPSDAAKLLNLPTHRVLKMIQCRALPARRVGSDWRLRKSEVIKWAQQHHEI